MTRKSVVSSDLLSVGYDSSSRTLEIEFKKSGVYQFFSVPESKYSALMSARSHGKYFDEYIKKGGYAYKKIG